MERRLKRQFAVGLRVGSLAWSTFCAFIFPLSQSWAAYLTEVYRFEGPAAAYPAASLIQATDGYMYGTTISGGTSNSGTIFQITTNGQLRIIVSFTITNGASPYASLLQADDGYLYGTTSSGGQWNLGTVFRVTTNGALTSLISFNGDNGATPYSSLIQDSDGYLYGTTYAGGTSNLGTVFQLTTNGALNPIVSFSGTDGSHPRATLVKAFDGTQRWTPMFGPPNTEIKLGFQALHH